MPQLKYPAIDWNQLRREAFPSSGSRRRDPSSWDQRARSFAKRNSGSLYARKFIALLRPQPHWTILDVGSGPGTLALPLARLVSSITCLDFSAEMLAIVRERCQEEGLDNIRTCRISWSEDWSKEQLPRHRVALASRSLGVADLKGAISRLSAHASDRVVVTDTVRHGPADPAAFQAIGRPLQSKPDYIYTLNLLYQLGYLARVEFIRLDEPLCYGSLAEALAGYAWMFPQLDHREEGLLKKYLRSIASRDQDGTITLHRAQVPTWAFISWNPHER
ncbi:class I SAM-dependent methyltransferase [Desulfogranum mediterraneum]|uniref:class I SAM-dependent methyltransferase n=1 Tax=Desulfogranum mediterraneum TaxID=160661 RepID=UPI00041FDC24|nr:methyltransferase domain-containing protein [Desulfogranum mediterraneum]